MKCPRCGKSAGYVGSTKSYMSAFEVDNNLAKCKSCGHEFDTTLLPKEPTITIGRSPDKPRQRFRRVRMKKGATGWAPVLDESTPLPFLNQPVIAKPKEAKSSAEWQAEYARREKERLENVKTREKELEEWNKMEHPKDLTRMAPWKAKDKISAYRTKAVAAQDAKVREAREWAARKNKELKQ